MNEKIINCFNCSHFKVCMRYKTITDLECKSFDIVASQLDRDLSMENIESVSKIVGLFKNLNQELITIVPKLCKHFNLTNA